MRIFLAGIMQGSHLGELMHRQDYRSQLRNMLEQHLPEAEVYDPLADHRQSLAYEYEVGREIFQYHNAMCGEVDVLVAFVPEASMGTAIEMWEAHRNGRVVISISPLRHNWAIKYCSDALYANLDTFAAELRSGRLAEIIARKLGPRRRTAPQPAAASA